MKLTVLVDTDGLPSVPCSFALAFAFLAASRFFLESDTICAVWAQLLWIVRKLSKIEIAPSPENPRHANVRRHGLTVGFRQQEARCIMPNINPANGSSSPSFSIRSSFDWSLSKVLAICKLPTCNISLTLFHATFTPACYDFTCTARFLHLC